MNNYPVNSIIERWSEHALKNINMEMVKHCFTVKDLLIGLHPSQERILKAHNAISKLADCPDKYRIMNFLTGAM